MEDSAARLLSLAIEDLGFACAVLDPQLAIVTATPEADRLTDGALVRGSTIVKALCGDAAERPIAEALAAGRPASGAIVRPDRPASLDEAARVFAASFGDREGVVIEVKSLGVGIHYRLDPSVEDAAHALAQAFAATNDLEVQHGKMMIELRLPGHDKGSAIAALMDRAPFAGHPPVFLGDDLTDEPGFAAASRLGGAGIVVGPPRNTAARYRLDSVATVRAWLGGRA